MGIVSGRTVAWKRVIGSVIGERLGVEQKAQVYFGANQLKKSHAARPRAPHTRAQYTQKKLARRLNCRVPETLSLNAHRLVISVGLWRISSCLPR